MCRRCSRMCDCNSSCLFGVAIPLRAGVFLNSLWIVGNGLAFPWMSWMFWPQEYIFVPSCAVGACVVVMGLCLLLSLVVKWATLIDVLVYGLCGAYVVGALDIMVSVNIAMNETVRHMVGMFKTRFGLGLSESVAVQYVHMIQIVFYTYLFLSYVYCGFVAQLYQRRILDGWYEKKPAKV